MAKLKTYHAKRDFGKTSEPRGAAGGKAKKSGNQYVIQKHDATRLHYDLRLELRRRDAELGGDARPEPDPRRQAPRHPRRGSSDRIQHVRRHHPERPVRRRHGDDLGSRALDTRVRSREGNEERPSRIHRSTARSSRAAGIWCGCGSGRASGRSRGCSSRARTNSPAARNDPDILEEMPNSAATGRTMEQIAEGRSRVWHSNKPASEQSSRRVAPKKKAVARSAAGGAQGPAARAARQGNDHQGRIEGQQEQIRRLDSPRRANPRRAQGYDFRSSCRRASPR